MGIGNSQGAAIVMESKWAEMRTNKSSSHKLWKQAPDLPLKIAENGPLFASPSKKENISTGLRHAVVIYSRFFVDHSKHFELFLQYFPPYPLLISWKMRTWRQPCPSARISWYQRTCGGRNPFVNESQWPGTAIANIFEAIFICQSRKCSIEWKPKADGRIYGSSNKVWFFLKGHFRKLLLRLVFEWPNHLFKCEF